MQQDKARTSTPCFTFYGPARMRRIPKAARDELDVADFEPFAEHLVPGAKIIYEMGSHRHYGQPNHYSDFPSLTQSAAR